MHGKSHEDKEEDDDNNNTNNNDDNDGDFVPQQQQTITHDHPRIRKGRGHRTRGQQQPPTNQIQQDEKPRRTSRRTRCDTSFLY